MARNRFIIFYDIRDPRRLREVASFMESIGDRMQYSVFVCDLNRSELVHARAGVERIMNLAVDSVMIVDLGPASDQRFTFLGRRYPLPGSEPFIT